MIPVHAIPVSPPELRGRKSPRGRPVTPVFVIFIGILFLFLFCAPAPAAAEDDTGIWLPRHEAASLFAIAAEAPRLHEKVAELERALATANARADALEKLAALERELLARQERLTALADEERDVYRARAERIEKDAGKGKRWLRCRANAGPGALLGAAAGSAFPGLGNLAGGAVGAVVGCVTGFVGS